MAWIKRNVLIQYLRKQITRQPLAVSGSGGGSGGAVAAGLNFSSATNSQYVPLIFAGYGG